MRQGMVLADVYDDPLMGNRIEILDGIVACGLTQLVYGYPVFFWFRSEVAVTVHGSVRIPAYRPYGRRTCGNLVVLGSSTLPYLFVEQVRCRHTGVCFCPWSQQRPWPAGMLVHR
jgi:hypothetical protein